MKDHVCLPILRQDQQDFSGFTGLFTGPAMLAAVPLYRESA
jgi:hypothetical protein